MVFDMIGQILGITLKQLDDFFETKDYTYLLPSEPANKEKRYRIVWSSLNGLKKGSNLSFIPQTLKVVSSST